MKPKKDKAQVAKKPAVKAKDLEPKKGVKGGSWGGWKRI